MKVICGEVQFQNGSAECLHYDNLSLDLEKNTATLNGVELSLTAKEFAILELLMKYPDKVFSEIKSFSKYLEYRIFYRKQEDFELFISAICETN